MLPLLLLGLACSSPEVDPAPDTKDDTADNIDTDDPPLTIDTGSAGGLTGTIPEVALAAPEFVATNLDDTERTQVDLIGHPTVMWFYPLANSPG
jgi:hypothetical protein